jgi:hypothetical protein
MRGEFESVFESMKASASETLTFVKFFLRGAGARRGRGEAKISNIEYNE